MVSAKIEGQTYEDDVLVLTQDNFYSVMEQHKGKVFLVEFYAPWFAIVMILLIQSL